MRRTGVEDEDLMKFLQRQAWSLPNRFDRSSIVRSDLTSSVSQTGSVDLTENWP